MIYIVMQRYYSSYGGPWTKGQELSMESEQAVAVNRDAPGTLLTLEEFTLKTVVSQRQTEKPQNTRQKRKSKTRSTPRNES